MGRNRISLYASDRSRPPYQIAAFYGPFVLLTGAVLDSTYVLFDALPRLDMPKTLASTFLKADSFGLFVH